MPKPLAPLLAVLCLLPCAAPVADAAPGDVKTSFALPCRYPAGLALDGALLYVVDWRTAEIHVLQQAGGTIVRTLAAPTLKPHGLTFGEGLLWVSDDHSGWVYALDPATGGVERSFEAPGPGPAGLAFHDGVLFVLERKSGQIYKVLPDDGTILKYFDAPSRTCTCLAHDGRYLWAADRIKDELYLVCPETGQVLSILAAPGPHPTGLAWDGEFLWNVDFQQRQAYQLIMDGRQKYRLSEPRRARVALHWALYNYGPSDVRDLRVNLAVPVTLPNQKLLSEPAYESPPNELTLDQWGQPCALYRIDQVPGGTRQVLGYQVEAEVSAIRYLIQPHLCGTLADIPADIREAYTVDGARYRLDSPFIQKTVKSVVGDEQNPYWIARKIFNHLIGKLDYEMVGGWDVPEVVLERGSGSCSEYTFAFIALCRAAGLPARYQGSLVVRGDDASVDEAFHRWAQVYLPNYGWVPIDANKGDAKLPADQARGFGELPNRFLITTQGGGDSRHLRWGYNYHAAYKTTGFSKLEEEALGFWEPLDPWRPAQGGMAMLAGELVLTRTGGFAGTDDRVVIDPSGAVRTSGKLLGERYGRVSEVEMAALASLLTNWTKSSYEAPTPRGAADDFMFSVTYRGHIKRWSSLATGVPAELIALATRIQSVAEACERSE